MNDRTFRYWGEVRKKGCLTWVFRSTLIISIVYIGFSILFNYPSSGSSNFIDFLKDEGLVYVTFPCLMFFFNWGLWLYRESKYKQELERRDVA
ncbi:hypothetical protein LH716_004228 [Vibrio vulnificus]|uniref:hypothetical protein n=1 Tax=Vibrio TaxID=662 RepID=UPI001CDCE7A6|nr:MULTISPECIES: hypothetical protein [Vibrio]EIJ0971140.1 hypothetical protein [Vibrio vulnificus]ELP6989797.1 hypothetical protein [Vibrio vulnificus]MCA3895412.1 hypothetical protein [Vibrio vulnificus]MCE9832420.1 hypothetical protein [Vibrio diabolicus]MCU8238784.1 hypothetical protein [Vibrio vulnificus]